VVAVMAWSVAASAADKEPSFTKDVKPFLAKYCLECHNARTQKGTLSLETFKAIMDGSDAGPVIVPGQPDKSKLVLLASVEEAKFRRPVLPGHQLRIEMKVTKRKASVAKMHGQATVDGLVMAEAILMCKLADRAPQPAETVIETTIPVP